MLSAAELQRNREIKANFLVNREIPDEHRLGGDMKPFGFIYCIESYRTGRKYIGSTYSIFSGVQRPRPMSSLMKRANQYIYEYNKALKSDKENYSHRTRVLLNRPIIRAMVLEGIENFVMYPIAETTKENHFFMEQFFIDKFKTVETGYNVSKVAEINSPLHRHTDAEKKKLSEPVMAFNLNRKEIVYADSMKLFADFIGSSKDMIKNTVRTAKPQKGWFVFYINKDKREYILQHAVLCDQSTIRKADRHSEKSQKFYIDLYDMVDKYLAIHPKENSEYFSDFTRLPDLEYDT